MTNGTTPVVDCGPPAGDPWRGYRDVSGTGNGTLAARASSGGRRLVPGSRLTRSFLQGHG